ATREAAGAAAAASAGAGVATDGAAAEAAPAADDAVQHPAAPATVRYESITTQEALDALVARIDASPLVALDTETTSLSYMRAELVGIAIAWAPGEAAYIPLAHRYPGAPDQLDTKSVLERLRPWLEGAKLKVGHHAKFDMHILENHGIEIQCEYDTMLESYVLN